MNNGEDPRLTRLRSGSLLEFERPPASGPDPLLAQRTIPAAWLLALVDGGRALKSIRLRHARIDGHIDLSYATFRSDVVFEDCIFLGRVDFSFANFRRRAQFQGTHFQDRSNFNGIRTRHALNLRLAIFSSEATFFDCKIGSVLDCAGTQFQEAQFDRLRARVLFFTPVSDAIGNLRSSQFAGDANFLDARVETNAIFQGAKFNGGAHFDRMRIEGSLVFNVPVRDRAGKKIPAPAPCTEVTGDASFVEMRVGDTGFFSGTRFGGRADFRAARFGSQAVFGSVRIDGIDFVTRFGGDIGFQRVQVFDTLEFIGVQFDGAANFSLVRVQGNILFGPATYRDDQHREHPIGVTEFKHQVTFNDAYIGGTANFHSIRCLSSATFERTRIDGSLAVAGLWLNGLCHQPWFGGDVSFVGCHVEGATTFEGAEFGKAANFHRMRIADNAFFRANRFGSMIAPTRFFEKANFFETRIEGTANFDGVQFLGEADFGRIRIGGDAIFRSMLSRSSAAIVCFVGDVSFFGAFVEGSGHFVGSVFLGKAEFVGTTFKRNLSCEALQMPPTGAGLQPRTLRTLFRGSANFLRVAVGGDALFADVRVNGNLNLEGVVVGGHLFVRSDAKANGICRNIRLFGADVGGTLDLYRTRVVNVLNMMNVRLRSGARLERLHCGGAVFLGGASVAHAANFKGARFGETVTFDGASIGGSAELAHASFRGDVSLTNAYFSTAELYRGDVGEGGASVRVGGRVDLRSFRYDRISVEWVELFEKLHPYDRQPYQQLERFFRATGDDRAADDVYVARRRKESDRLRKRVLSEGLSKAGLVEIPPLVLDMVQGWLRYGVRPIWLLWAIIGSLVLGTAVFHQPGAVVPKEQKATKLVEELMDDNRRAGQPVPLQVERAVRMAGRDFFAQPLTWGEAFGLSARLFVPIVELPFGTEWVPARYQPVLGVMPVDVYASFHRLGGAVLVPLAVAALTGLLVRRARAAEGGS